MIYRLWQYESIIIAAPVYCCCDMDFIITPANKFHYAINPIAQYNQMRSAVYTAPRRQKVSLIFMAVHEQSIFSPGFLHGPYETYHRL